MLLYDGDAPCGLMYQAPRTKGDTYPAESTNHHHRSFTIPPAWQQQLCKAGALVRPIAERPNVACLPSSLPARLTPHTGYPQKGTAPDMAMTSPLRLPQPADSRMNVPYSVPVPAYTGGQMLPKFLPKWLPMAAFMLPSKYPMGKKTFRCSQCRYLTDRKNNLKRHVATMHADCGKTLECCDVIFKSKAALRDHVLLFHRSGYKCRFCSRNFCRKALLKRHLAVHNGQKEFGCGDCDYATSHKSNLERHRRVHGEEGPDTDDEAGSDGGWIPEDMVKDDDNQTIEVDSMSDSDIDIDDTMVSHRKPASHKSLYCLPDRLKETHTDDDEGRTSAEPKVAAPMDSDSEGHAHTDTPPPRTSDSPGGRRRLFPTPYKCPECGLCFSSQQLLCLHAGGCREERQEPARPVTSIVRPFLDGPALSHPLPSATSSTMAPSSRRAATFNIADLLPFTYATPVMSTSAQHPHHRLMMMPYPSLVTVEAAATASPERSVSPQEEAGRQLPLKKRSLTAHS